MARSGVRLEASGEAGTSLGFTAPAALARKHDGDFACDEPAGCVATGEKCFVFQVKEMWLTGRLAKIKDKLILLKVKNLQAEFIKHSKKKHSDTFVAEIAKTLDLAPKKYRDIVMESVEEEEERVRIIRILDDYVGPTATRYDFYVLGILVAEWRVL